MILSSLLLPHCSPLLPRLVKIILTLIKFWPELDSWELSNQQILNFLLVNWAQVRQTAAWLAGSIGAQTTEPTTFGLLGAICHSEKLLERFLKNLRGGNCQLWVLSQSESDLTWSCPTPGESWSREEPGLSWCPPGPPHCRTRTGTPPPRSGSGSSPASSPGRQRRGRCEGGEEEEEREGGGERRMRSPQWWPSVGDWGRPGDWQQRPGLAREKLAVVTTCLPAELLSALQNISCRNSTLSALSDRATCFYF